MSLATDLWLNENFTYPAHIPTMITREETLYLHWLGRFCWDGQGEIMEIGPWLGGSTACLAAGMMASGHPPAQKLMVYDNFLWREFMAQRAPLDLKPGESFQPAFEQYVEKYRNYMKSFAMTLPDEVIEGDPEAEAKRFQKGESVPPFIDQGQGPLQIIFIDGAKSWRGMVHLLRQVVPRLVPGSSLLVCQDYKYYGTYWVPLMMNRLAEWLKPVHNTLSATTVTFQLEKTIPEHFLQDLEDSVSDLDTPKSLGSIESAAELLSAMEDHLGACNVSLAKVAFLAHQEKLSMAVEIFQSIQSSWPQKTSSDQLELARKYMVKNHQASLPKPIGLKLESLTRRVNNRLIGLSRRIKSRLGF